MKIPFLKLPETLFSRNTTLREIKEDTPAVIHVKRQTVWDAVFPFSWEGYGARSIIGRATEIDAAILEQRLIEGADPDELKYYEFSGVKGKMTLAEILAQQVSFVGSLPSVFDDPKAIINARETMNWLDLLLRHGSKLKDKMALDFRDRFLVAADKYGRSDMRSYFDDRDELEEATVAATAPARVGRL